MILIRNDGNEIYHHLLSRQRKNGGQTHKKAFVSSSFIFCLCATSASIYQIERERKKLFGNQIDRCISVCTVTLERTWGRLSTGVRFSLKEKKKSLLEFFVFKFLYYFVLLLFCYFRLDIFVVGQQQNEPNGLIFPVIRWEMCVCTTQRFSLTVFWLLCDGSWLPLKKMGVFLFFPPSLVEEKRKIFLGIFQFFFFLSPLSF